METKTKKELILEELKIAKEIDLNSNDNELMFKFAHTSDMLYLKESFDKAQVRAFNTKGTFIENINIYNITGACINAKNKCIYMSHGIDNEIGYVCKDISLHIDIHNNYVILLKLDDESFRSIMFNRLPELELNEKTMLLCEGRHDIPQAIDGAIFPSVVNPTDINALQRTVREKLENVTHLKLYVTGLTVALIEVINYCSMFDIELTLYHYNKDTNNYYAQDVYL